MKKKKNARKEKFKLGKFMMKWQGSMQTCYGQQADGSHPTGIQNWNEIMDLQTALKEGGVDANNLCLGVHSN